MSSVMPFSAKSLASLGSIKVVVSKFMPDDQVVFQENNHPKRAFASYRITIWNLDTGKMNGNADITKADEIHMSAKRFKQIQDMPEFSPTTNTQSQGGPTNAHRNKL